MELIITEIRSETHFLFHNPRLYFHKKLMTKYIIQLYSVSAAAWTLNMQRSKCMESSNRKDVVLDLYIRCSKE